MGSGLILLVIVGAWLAVLVPMGLRAQDGSPSRPTERIGDAVRVLRRRGAPAPEPAVEPDEEAAASDDAAEPGRARGSRVLAASGSAAQALRSGAGRASGSVLQGGRRVVRGGGRVLHGSVRVATRVQVAVRPPTGPVRRPAPVVSRAAVRRRRTLLVLLLLTVAAVLAGLVGPARLLAVAAALGLLTVLYVLRCRQVAARTRLRRRQAAREARLAAAERTVAVRVRRARVPVEQPVLEQPVLDQPAAQEPVAPPALPEQAPARPVRRTVAAGQEWQPVPVPLPMYVGKAVAPRPAPAPLRPSRRAPDVASLDDPGAPVDRPAARRDDRRAVGDW